MKEQIRATPHIVSKRVRCVALLEVPYDWDVHREPGREHGGARGQREGRQAVRTGIPHPGLRRSLHLIDTVRIKKEKVYCFELFFSSYGNCSLFQSCF